MHHQIHNQFFTMSNVCMLFWKSLKITTVHTQFVIILTFNFYLGIGSTSTSVSDSWHVQFLFIMPHCPVHDGADQRLESQKFEPARFICLFWNSCVQTHCFQDCLGRWKQDTEATPGKAGQTSGRRIGEEKIKESVWQIHFSL